MEKLPVELVLQNILELQHSDIKSICSVSQYIRNICKDNENYIYKKLLERDYGSWTKSPKGIYQVLNNKIDLIDFDIYDDQEFFFINKLVNRDKFKQLHFLHKLHIIDIDSRNGEGDNILLNHMNHIYDNIEESKSKNFIEVFEKIIELGIDINTFDYYDSTVLDNILDCSRDITDFQITILVKLLRILIKYKVKVRKSNIATAEDNNLPKDLIGELKKCRVLEENPEYNLDMDERSVDSRTSFFSQSWDGY